MRLQHDHVHIVHRRNQHNAPICPGQEPATRVKPLRPRAGQTGARAASAGGAGGAQQTSSPQTTNGMAGHIVA
eukprot:2463945-Prymnesium_polylepis.1